MTIFEDELYLAVRNNLKVRDKKPKMYVLMYTAEKHGYINREQRKVLDLMWDRRGNTNHHSEQSIKNSKNPLTESEARAAVAYLGQVIALLGS